MGDHSDAYIKTVSPQSYADILESKSAYERAKAKGDTVGMQNAHERAESIRAQFGYSGGADGSLFEGIAKQQQGSALYGAAMGQLQSSTDAQQAAIQAEVDRYLLKLSGQIPEINQNAFGANAQAHQAYLAASNPFGANAQAQAKLGLANSGFSESNLAGLGNAYQSVIGQNEQAHQRYLRDVESAKQDAVFSGNLQKANAAVEQAKALAQMQFNMGNNLMGYGMQEMSMAQNQAQFDEKMTSDLSRQERTDLEEMAAFLAKYGVFDGYRALGATDQQIAAMKAFWDNQQWLNSLKAMR